MLEDLLSVAETCALLGRTATPIYQAIKTGRLPSVRLLGRYAIRRQDAEEYRTRTAGVGAKGGRPRKARLVDV